MGKKPSSQVGRWESSQVGRREHSILAPFPCLQSVMATCRASAEQKAQEPRNRLGYPANLLYADDSHLAMSPIARVPKFNRSHFPMLPLVHLLIINLGGTGTEAHTS
jgi:hypothetical protein